MIRNVLVNKKVVNKNNFIVYQVVNTRWVGAFTPHTPICPSARDILDFAMLLLFEDKNKFLCKKIKKNLKKVYYPPP